MILCLFTPIGDAMLESGDTCTSVSVDKEEWLELHKRFLFLQPPHKYVQTEAGEYSNTSLVTLHLQL